jgi:pimeloyl-ACP methyl ester carboxylesterase
LLAGHFFEGNFTAPLMRVETATQAMVNTSNFRGPMSPWPGLETCAREIELPKSGLRLFAFVSGEPKPVTMVLLHGLGDEADTWRHLIGPLSTYAQVVAPDLPGFGRSDKPRRKYTAHFLCDAISELVEQLGISNAIVVGSSMGAVLAQNLALGGPAWLKGLVLIDGTLLNQAQRIDPTLLLFMLPGWGEWLYTRLRKDPQAAYESLRTYYANLDSLPREEQRFLFQRVNQRVWDDAQRHAYLSTLRNLGPHVAGQQKGLIERLSRLALPTLILWGAQDRVLPLASGQAAAAAQPSARLVILPEAGHLPHQEQPQAVLQAFLEDERLGRIYNP